MMSTIMSHLDLSLKAHFDAHSLSADQLARQLDQEEQRNNALNQVAAEIAEAAMKGDYSKIDLFDIQEAEADTEMFWDKSAELREAWFNGVRGGELESLVASLMGVTYQVAASIAADYAPEELAQRNADMIISMREAS